MVQIAYLTDSWEKISKLESNIQEQYAELNEQQQVLDLQNKFIQAAKIYHLVDSFFKPDFIISCNLYSHPDLLNEEYDYIGCFFSSQKDIGSTSNKLNQTDNKILTQCVNVFKKNLLNFILSTITDSKIQFKNTHEGKIEFLKTIMCSDYELWLAYL